MQAYHKDEEKTQLRFSFQLEPFGRRMFARGIPSKITTTREAGKAGFYHVDRTNTVIRSVKRVWGDGVIITIL